MDFRNVWRMALVSRYHPREAAGCIATGLRAGWVVFLSARVVTALRKWVVVERRSLVDLFVES